eukprot:12686802-Alexandrium_andersonii.AAC.1
MRMQCYSLEQHTSPMPGSCAQVLALCVCVLASTQDVRAVHVHCFGAASAEGSRKQRPEGPPCPRGQMSRDHS